MKNLIIGIFLFFGIFQSGFSQDSKFDLYGGIRVQKTHKLYWENGISLDFSMQKIFQKKLHLNFSVTSSRIGSAFKSNAIRQENYLMDFDWRFRSKKSLQFFTGLGLGYFHSDLEEEIFDILPNNSFLFSIHGGVFYKMKLPLAGSFSYSYNLISGDGVNGPGSLFPVYFQCSLFYIFKR